MKSIFRQAEDSQYRELNDSIVLVCGGRDFYRPRALNRALDMLHADRPIGLLVQGGARGADRLAAEWAARNEVPCVNHPAKWSKYKKSAGHRRNYEMLSRWQPTLVVAFPGGKGTANMVDKARRYGVEVMEISASDLDSLSPVR